MFGAMMFLCRTTWFRLLSILTIHAIHSPVDGMNEDDKDTAALGFIVALVGFVIVLLIAIL
jgi:hypothetical protein